MTTTTQASDVGERLVAHWLAKFGYVTNVDKIASDFTDIEAGIVVGRDNARSLLVQVKSAVQPSTPAELSEDEIRDITSRAARLGFEAWAACVQLDQQLRQVGEIRWRKLT